MKKLNYIKFIIDLIMAIIFTLLFNKMLFGMVFHEIVGLVIGGVVLVHCGLNFKWIKAITLKLFNKNVKLKTRITYILDIILLINVLVIIVSGIFISKVVFKNLGLNGVPLLKAIHIPSSYLLLMLIGIHLGLHWNWVMIIFKKIFKIPEKRILIYISRALTIIVMIFGIYSFNSIGYLSKLSINSFNKEGSKPNMELRENEQGDSKKEFENNNENIENSKDKYEEKRDEYSSNGEGFNGKPMEGDVHMGGNSNILSVITLHLGIISVFMIITYYLEQIIKRKTSLFSPN